MQPILTLLNTSGIDVNVVTGGDAIWDRFLLAYTTQNGLRLWTGDDGEYRLLKEKYFKDQEIYHLAE